MKARLQKKIRHKINRANNEELDCIAIQRIINNYPLQLQMRKLNQLYHLNGHHKLILDNETHKYYVKDDSAIDDNPFGIPMVCYVPF